MTPEAKEHFHKARQCLIRARTILVAGIGEDAGRNAYLAAFHAAQALIAERTGKEAKAHKGVHAQFARLTRNEPRLGRELRQFLARAYDMKSIADYGLGLDTFRSDKRRPRLRASLAQTGENIRYSAGKTRDDTQRVAVKSWAEPPMTKLLDQALEAARNLPPDEQDNIAHVVLRLAGADDEPPVPLTSEEHAAITDSKAAAARGEFATDEQVRAVWAKHGL